MDIHSETRRLWIIARRPDVVDLLREPVPAGVLRIDGAYEYEQYDLALARAEQIGGVLVGVPVIHDFTRPASRRNAATAPDSAGGHERTRPFAAGSADPAS